MYIYVNTNKFDLCQQRCSTNDITQPSMHGNVAILMYGINKNHIFAARNQKQRNKL